MACLIFNPLEIIDLESLGFTVVENSKNSAILQIRMEALNIVRTVAGRFMLGREIYSTKAALMEALYAEYLAQLNIAQD